RLQGSAGHQLPQLRKGFRCGARNPVLSGAKRDQADRGSTVLRLLRRPRRKRLVLLPLLRGEAVSRPSRWVIGVLLAAISLNGCGGGIRLRSNVAGAAVRMDGENSVIAVVPGALIIPADKPHILTF